MKQLSALIVLLLFSSLTFAQQATITGRITDATNGNPIADAQITVGERYTLADNNGDFQLADIQATMISADFSADRQVGDVPLTVQFYDSSKTGFQTVLISAEGYFTAEKHLQIDEDTDLRLDVSLSPVITDAEYRFVLNWGETPKDLDLILYMGSTLDNGATRISWADKGDLNEFPFAQLDIDVVESYGPETITVQSLLQTDYLLFVNNFSGETLFGESDAVVRIYNRDGLLHTVNAPTLGNGEYWNICDIDGETGDLVILNEIIDNNPVSGLAKTAAIKQAVPQIISWQWDFDSDGEIDAEDQNPVFTYYEPGLHSVTLHVSDGTQTASVTKEDYIAARNTTTVLQGLDLNISRIDASEFPAMSVQLAVKDSNGVTPDLSLENFEMTEAGEPNNMLSLLKTGIEHHSAVDIVFVIDASSSMNKEKDIEQAIAAFADSLQVVGMLPRFALVTFADWVLDVYDFTSDIDLMKTWLQGLNKSDGGDDNENALEALNQATKMGFRENAQKIAVLFTDSGYHIAGDSGDGETDFTTDSMIERLQKEFVSTFIFGISTAEMNQLAKRTGGLFFSMFSDIASGFNAIAHSLADQYVLSFRGNTEKPLDSWRDLYFTVQSNSLGGNCTAKYLASSSTCVMNPPVMYGIKDQQVSFDLLVKNVVDLSAAHFVVTYDPQKFSIVDVHQGDFLSQGNALLAFVENIDAINGSVDITTNRLAGSAAAGVSGTGVLATLVFNTLAEDCDASFDFSTAQFQHANGADCPMVSRPATAYSIQDGGESTLIGDFDNDLDIDTADFARLASYWSPVDLPFGDIGPAAGTVPILSIEKDNFVNYNDLFVFTQMWNWYHSTLLYSANNGLAKTTAKLDFETSEQGDQVVIHVYAGHLHHLAMGHIAFDISKQDLELIDVSAGGLFGETANISMLSEQEQSGCSITFTKLAGSGESAFVSGEGEIAQLRFKRKTTDDIRINFKSVDLRTPENLPLAVMTTVEDRSLHTVPAVYKMTNYPNPFNGTTKIQYTMPASGRVQIAVINMLGQTVRMLADEHKQAGEYNVTWDCRNDVGFPVSTGVYMLKMSTLDHSVTKKILYVR